jgi:aromatic ring-opening dioxygenase LigB subunit
VQESSLTLVYACIAPHGDEIVPALAGKNLALFSPTRKGMRRLAAQMRKARPDTIIVASPHNLRLLRHIGVVTSEYSTGRVALGGGEVCLRAMCDVELAVRIVESAGKRGIPAVGANYGTSSGDLSDLPMDWGTLIPLWFFLKPRRSKTKIVIVTPSREIPLVQNFEFGSAVAEVLEEEPKRTAFVASADQAHTHRKGGPYGYSMKAVEYDSRVLGSIRANRLESIMGFEPEFVEAAKPDSLWQMTMLAGILDKVPMRGEIFSYQVPTYYGMLCAGYTR